MTILDVCPFAFKCSASDFTESYTHLPFSILLASYKASTYVPGYRLSRLVNGDRCLLRSASQLKSCRYILESMALPYQLRPPNTQLAPLLDSTSVMREEGDRRSEYLVLDGPVRYDIHGSLLFLSSRAYNIVLYRDGTIIDDVPAYKEALEATLEHQLPELHIYQADTDVLIHSDMMPNLLFDYMLTDELDGPSAVYPLKTMMLASMATRPLKDTYYVLNVSDPTDADIAQEMSTWGLPIRVDRVDVLPAEPIWRRAVRVRRYPLYTNMVAVHDTEPFRAVLSGPYLDAYNLAMPFLPGAPPPPAYMTAFLLHSLAREVFLSRGLWYEISDRHLPKVIFSAAAKRNRLYTGQA